MIKQNSKKICALLTAGILCLSILSGCASEKSSAVSSNSDSSQQAQKEVSGTPSDASSDRILGEFTTQDINGQTYTQDIFKDYELTMVNVFTTWCSPCVSEIPDLEKLRRSMKDQGVHVVGIVLDTVDEKGEIDQEGLEKAKLLAEQTGAEYPFLIPDKTLLNGRLAEIDSVPETFFVDKNGNIVGENYSGSGSFEYWTEIVQKELSNLKAGA